MFPFLLLPTLSRPPGITYRPSPSALDMVASTQLFNSQFKTGLRPQSTAWNSLLLYTHSMEGVPVTEHKVRDSMTR